MIVLLFLRCKMLVVGAGTGGCSMAAKLAPVVGANKTIILDPSERHYYQPMFTMIGGGMKHLPESYRLMKTVLPKKVKWVRDAASGFDPKENKVFTQNGHTIEYEFLIIACGLELKYDKVNSLWLKRSLNPLNVYILSADTWIE